MQSRTDVRRQSIQLTGATVEDARRAEGWSVRRKRNGDGRVAPKRRTRYFLVQPSLPLNQATLVRGAFGVTSTDASRSSLSPSRNFLCLKRSKHKATMSTSAVSSANRWRMWSVPIRIWAMDPELISKVMREMGRKGGKKGGKKGAKVRMETLTPEQRTQIARNAAKARWAKTKKKNKA